MNDDEPVSPCMSVCLLDEQEICVGCFRSSSEVTEWFMSSAEEKLEILKRSKERREAAEGRR